MMRFDFSQNCWNAADFLPAASVRVPYRLAFGQKDDCIHNEGADKAGDEYAYVSMALAQRLKAPCLLSTECAFNKYGAPLILLADEIIALPDGRWQYGHHIEIVGWEKGLNLWDITPDPAADHGQRVKKIGALSFPVKGESVLKSSSAWARRASPQVCGQGRARRNSIAPASWRIPSTPALRPAREKTIFTISSWNKISP